MKTFLVWVFRILLALAITIFLWNLLIGTDLGNTYQKDGQGAIYAQVMFGTDEVSGMKRLTQQTWLENSGYNGFWTSQVREDYWKSAAKTSTYAHTW